MHALRKLVLIEKEVQSKVGLTDIAEYSRGRMNTGDVTSNPCQVRSPQS